MSATGVLLVSFGGPEKPEDVRPFIENVLRGRPVPPARFEEVVQHYLDLGGRSPLTELTARQGAALQAELARRGRPFPVHVGMRNWTPFLSDVLAAMAERGLARAVTVLLAPHRGEAATGRYERAIEAALQTVGPQAPRIAYVDAWNEHPGLIDAWADAVRAALATLPDAARDRAVWLFTAHSIPTRSPGADTYLADLKATCAALAARFPGKAWQLVFQSRSGSPADPWYEPDVSEAIRAAAAAGAPAVLLVPVGFVCDHMEVLYDLDRVAAQTARDAGLACARAATPHEHPRFIAALADEVLKAVDR